MAAVFVTQTAHGQFSLDVRAVGGGHGESWYVSMYGRACNKILSMKILSRYLGNAASSLSGSTKILDCCMGNRLAAINNFYVSG